MSLKTMKEKLEGFSNLVNFILLLGAIIGGYIAIEAHYAKAEEVQKLELRLEQKIILDQQDTVQERIWRYEDRYKNIELAPADTKEEYRLLKKRYESLDKSLNIIQMKMEQ